MRRKVNCTNVDTFASIYDIIYWISIRQFISKFLKGCEVSKYVQDERSTLTWKSEQYLRMRTYNRSDYSHVNFTAFSKIIKKYFFSEINDVTTTHMKLNKCELLHSVDCSDPHAIFEKLQQHDDQCTNQ